MKSIRNIVLWALGVFFLLGSICMLLSSFVGSMCFLLIGVLFLPPIRKRYLSSFKWQMQGIIGFLLFIIAGLTNNNEMDRNIVQNKSTAKIEIHDDLEDESELVDNSEEESLSVNEVDEKQDIAFVRSEERERAIQKKEDLKRLSLIKSLEDKIKTTVRTGELAKLYEQLINIDPENSDYKESLKEKKKLMGDLLKVIGVSDGDSITVLTKDKKQIPVRLYAVDAPESGQEYSSKSKERLGKLLREAGEVYLEKKGKDKYGRVFAYVYLPDLTLVNRWSLKEGCAWHYKSMNSDSDLAQDEGYARKNKLGLWAGYNPMSPTKYRERQVLAKKIQAEKKKEELAKINEAKRQTLKSRATKKKETSTGGYWLNTSSGVRHNRGCRWYGNTSKGRSCSSSEGRGCSKCGG